MKIYVASSWRNPWQPAVVRLLRDLGHEVYDFREPRPGEKGFAWSEIDPNWRSWTPEQYREALQHPLAEKGFKSDMEGLEANACVLVHPCGNDAHMELGRTTGRGLLTAVLFPHGFELTEIGGHTYSDKQICAVCQTWCVLPRRLDKVEPELMVKMADAILIGPEELREWVGQVQRRVHVAEVTK